MHEWIKAYNETLEILLKNACKYFVKNTGNSEIPLTILKDYIDSLKKGWKKGAEK